VDRVVAIVLTAMHGAFEFRASLACSYLSTNSNLKQNSVSNHEPPPSHTSFSPAEERYFHPTPLDTATHDQLYTLLQFVTRS